VRRLESIIGYSPRRARGPSDELGVSHLARRTLPRLPRSGSLAKAKTAERAAGIPDPATRRLSALADIFKIEACRGGQRKCRRDVDGIYIATG
jgi:hypothetical protein